MISEQQNEGWLRRALAKAGRALGLMADENETEQSGRTPMMASARTPPGNITGLRLVRSTPTTVALSWNKPTGTSPILFTVLMRIHGALYWNIGAFSGDPAATVQGLKPGTVYDFEILAHNN